MINTKTTLLASLAVLACVVGVLDYGPAKAPSLSGPVLMVHVTASVALIVAWFWLDSRQRAYKATAFLKVAMAGLTIFALPYYLLRSRGLRSGSRALALALGLFMATMTAYRAGAWLAQTVL
ncbi:MAG: hypothetical protein H7338_22540 [Candidatus Sericytochromatia bacterium]|nr:hypothetical protein [Candidatus Sericytochromatia bacterium]